MIEAPSILNLPLPQNGWTIVSGGVGVGKTTLVKSTDEVFYGKFSPTSPHQHGSSYVAFRSSLQALVKTVSKDISEPSVFGFDEADIHELLELFPFLSALFGNSAQHHDSVSTLQAKNNGECLESNAFAIINHLPSDIMFRIGLPDLIVRLITAISTVTAVKKRIVLEDWHWADDQSIDILEALFDHRKDIKFPIVCTYRDDVTPTSKSWNRLLNKMLTSQVTDESVSEMKLSCWTELQIRQFIAEQFRVVDGLKRLSQLLQQRTQGNPLFVYYFMELLAQEGIVKHPQSLGDSLLLEEAKMNIKKMFDPTYESALPTNLTQCVHRMVMNQRESLPTIKSLVTALSENPDGGINPKVLSMISSQISPKIESDLSRFPFFFDKTGRISFKHPEVQTCVLSLFSDEERAVSHHKNGILLWKNYQHTIIDNESILYLAVQQMRLGSVHITEPNEVSVFANLCLKAGERAMGSSRFSLAQSYFNNAIEKLGCWTNDMHDVLLTLHNLAAEASYAAGNFHQMDCHLKTVFEHSRSIKDSMRAKCTQLFANSARNNATSVDDALGLLKEFGADFPSNPGSLVVLRAFLKTRWVLRNKTDVDFLRLPVATDPDAIALMQIMFFAFTSLYITNPKLALVVSFRLIQLTMKHGLSGPSIAAFATYSFLLVGAFGWIDEAYKYGKISLQMGQAFSARPYLARGQLSFCA